MTLQPLPHPEPVRAIEPVKPEESANDAEILRVRPTLDVTWDLSVLVDR